MGPNQFIRLGNGFQLPEHKKQLNGVEWAASTLQTFAIGPQFSFKLMRWPLAATNFPDISLEPTPTAWTKTSKESDPIRMKLSSILEKFTLMGAEMLVEPQHHLHLLTRFDGLLEEI